MQKASELCLKYLMNELEPSEIIYMEKALEEDEDLLIELECMRATLNRLDKLGEIDPPREVRESVINKAVEYHALRQSFAKSYIWNKIGLYTAAAVLLAAVIGFSNPFNISALDALLEEPNEISAHETVQKTSQQAGFKQTKSPSKQYLQPWVDKNNILRLEDRYNKDRISLFDSAMHQSYKKLTPVQKLPAERLHTTDHYHQTNYQLIGSNK